MAKVSLMGIIQEVENEAALEGLKSVQERQLLRRFKQLIVKCGGNPAVLEDINHHIYFEEEEKDFVRTIIVQLMDEDGLSYKFLKDKEEATLEDVHDFIQNFIKEMEDQKVSEDEIKGTVTVLDRMFQFSVRAEVENCHRFIDSVAACLAPYPYTHELHYISRVSDTLRREAGCAIAEAAITTSELGEFFVRAKEIQGTDSHEDLYGHDQIAKEYRERDVRAFRFLQENPIIREFVENHCGASIEEIWGVN